MSLDGSEKVTSHGSQTVCEASIRRLLMRECLYSQGTGISEGFDLIRFESVGKLLNLISFDNCKMVTWWRHTAIHPIPGNSGINYFFVKTCIYPWYRELLYWFYHFLEWRVWTRNYLLYFLYKVVNLLSQMDQTCFGFVKFVITWTSLIWTYL